MDCAEAKLQIESYVAGEIADDRKGPLEEHLAACAECRLDSELTRASKNQPAEPDPNASPAAFVDSIRPDGGQSGPASGAGERPAGSTQAADGSWTLESIFGAGGSEGKTPGEAAARPSPPPAVSAESVFADEGESPRSALAERAAAAAAPLPEPDLPSILSGGTGTDVSDESPASDAPTWDFEPTDVKGSAKPPEGSLFFAEEALTRTGARKKPGVPKVVLWGAGGLVGVALLALSIWIAMTVRKPLPEAVSDRHPMRAGTGPAAPGTDTAVTPAPATPANPVTVDDPASPSSPAPVSAAPAGRSSAPSEAQAPNAPDANPAASAPPRGENAAPPAPKTLAVAPPLETPRAASSTPTHKPAPSGEAATRTASKPPATTKPAAAKPAPSKLAPAAPKRETSKPWPAAPVIDSGDEEEEVVTPPHAPKPAAPATPSTASSTSPAPGATTPAPSAESTPPPSAPADVVERPIDRLHLATLNAEQNADLAALRKLRDTWRAFVKTSIGPDRSRAKRELADCLWAVQTLTTKFSDQKEALAAYRDFVLNAPAGGADARTVARMRQLEDAVAESH
ncbi:MAG TPA: hypothetical protein VL503_09285 [Candidatus Omnitrophota bacterium]|nr:hypothetical protein [Candidatus Omnitrophota bacterium]